MRIYLLNNGGLHGNLKITCKCTGDWSSFTGETSYRPSFTYWQNKVTKWYGFTHIPWQLKHTSSEQHTTTSHSDIDLTKILAIIANFLILKSLLSSSAIVYSNSVCAVTGLSSDQSHLHPDCVITMEVLSTGMHLKALVVHVMILVLSTGLHLKTVVSYWDVLEWLTFS